MCVAYTQARDLCRSCTRMLYKATRSTNGLWYVPTAVGRRSLLNCMIPDIQLHPSLRVDILLALGLKKVPGACANMCSNPCQHRSIVGHGADVLPESLAFAAAEAERLFVPDGFCSVWWPPSALFTRSAWESELRVARPLLVSCHAFDFCGHADLARSSASFVCAAVAQAATPHFVWVWASRSRGVVQDCTVLP